MPRPKKLTGLFGKGGIPKHWDRVALNEAFYVSGLKDALHAGGVKAKVKTFKPHCKLAVKEGWAQQLPDDLWSEFSPDQARRALLFELITLPKAAMAILVAGHLVSRTKEGKKVDIYRKVRLVPAMSYISGLAFETYDDFVAVVSANAELMKLYGSVEKYLAKCTAQDDESVFYDIVRGKTVTATLAKDFLKTLKKHLPAFRGEVANDPFSRQRMIQKYRDEANHAAGSKERKYAKRISASKAETFRK